MGKSGYKSRPVAERFWEKVNRDGPIPPHRPELGPCWIWTAAINHHRGGYGMFALRKGVIRRAHRIAWELTSCPVPAGLMVLHRCDNPPCVRPAHLFTGTGGDNMADMHSKGRANRPAGEANSLAKLTDAEVVAIREARARGVKGRILAEQYGVRVTHIYQVSRGRWAHLGGATERAPARGEQSGRAILTEDDVRRIRAEYAAGRSCAEMGREVGLGRDAIWKAATRKTWRHI